MSRLLPRSVIALAAAGVVSVPAFAFASVAPGFTELVSTSSDGVQGNNDSELPSVSADGRYVAFTSTSNNLVAEDTNLSSDIFVRDRLTGTTERVSISSAGRDGEAHSGRFNGMGGPSISADGRYVAFDSESDLVRDDENGVADVFVHDRLTAETTRVSVASDGSEASGVDPTISADGRFVAFLSGSEALGNTDNIDDVFVHDRQTGLTERISEAPDGTEANSLSLNPMLSGNGQFVYFSSVASNLVPSQPDTDGSVDAFLFDRTAREMTAVTTALTAGSTGQSFAEGISTDGGFVTFTSGAPVLAPDANGFFNDAFLVDRRNNPVVVTRVSVNDDEVQADFDTFAGPVSDDGQVVAMVSRATNFGGPATLDENIYHRNLNAGTTPLVSVATDGTPSDHDSLDPAMTPDAHVTAFSSRASTFVPENQGFFAADIFVRDARAQADLAVTMVDSPDAVTARGELSYTVTVANNGPADATGTTLVDTLPDATFVSANAGQGTCVRTGKGKSGGVLTCDLGTLNLGGSTTVAIVVSPSKAGQISNTATASADQPDGNTGNDTATETTTVLPR